MKSPFPYNYHSHTSYCDGASQAEDYILACIEREYISYGFSSHAPIPGGSPWNMKAEDLDDYLTDINQLKQKYQNQIEIFCSLEVDYLDEVQGPSKYAPLLDYTIGSIHFIGKGNIIELFEMDGPYPKFLDGLEKHYQNDIREAVEHFFELTINMIRYDRPDIIGHVDKIHSHANRYEEAVLQSKWYRDIVHDVAKELSRTDIMVEINTKGLLASNNPSTYPHIDFLKILKQYPIRFQINADVHKTSQLDLGYADTLKNIKNLGIEELWVREKDQWKAKRI